MSMRLGPRPSVPAVAASDAIVAGGAVEAADASAGKQAGTVFISANTAVFAKRGCPVPALSTHGHAGTESVEATEGDRVNAP